MSEQIKYNLVDIKGQQAGQVELNADVFGADVDPSILHQVIKWQLAARRAGTHATKNLSKTDNNKKKPYKQKGTGRARAGSRYATNRVGGAVAHGPQPHGYDFKVNRKVKRAAVAGALSLKCREQQMCIVKDFAVSSPKTKSMTEIIKNLQQSERRKILVIVSAADDARSKESQLVLAGRNIAGLKFMQVSGLNVYDLMNADCVMFDHSCLPLIEAKVLGSEVLAA